MHLREVLKGMLKRTNSSSTTATTRTTRSNAESRPSSSSAGSALGTGNRNEAQASKTEAKRVAASVTETHGHGQQKDTTIVEESDESAAEEEASTTTSLLASTSTWNSTHLSAPSSHGGGQSPGREADGRLADEIKLHMDPAATAATAAAAEAATASTEPHLSRLPSEDHPPHLPSEHPAYDVGVDAEAEGATGHGNIVEKPALLVQSPTPDRVDSHLGAAQDVIDISALSTTGTTSGTATTTTTTTTTTPSITSTSSQPKQLDEHTSLNAYNEKDQQRQLSSSPAVPNSTDHSESAPTSSSTPLLQSHLDPNIVRSIASSAHSSSRASAPEMPASMSTRKIWVKRPGASATMVMIKEDDLVDDVRDMILRKYANSLGRSFDSPDVTLRIIARTDASRTPAERLLGPDEHMCRTLDTFYPGGQTVDEALIIDVPQRRTPRPSPRAYNHQNAAYHALDDFRPPESGTDYFPPMPVPIPAVIPPSAPHTAAATSTDPRSAHAPALHPDQRSISVLNTGQLPPLPSPGAMRRHREHQHRPKYTRQHTSSPTIMSVNQATAPVPNLTVSQHLPVRTVNRPRGSSNAADQHVNGTPAPPPLPTPPAADAPVPAKPSSTPPTPAARETSTLRPSRPRRSRKPTPTNVKSPSGTSKSSIPSNLLDNSVPPINVLIVEDNIINLKLLEAFMKRLKVRWSTAMNGQIAVNKWRAGGFHLVLMDIQLPIMSGLEATKEIRRLERVNGIGVFSNSAPTTPALVRPTSAVNEEIVPVELSQEEQAKQDGENDKLHVENGLFKSPVIIVALTASSLQSDRHEALAAGCNDFLTKPVNFVWLERKVKEWGCMQALIDFDGWRKWKDFTNEKKAKRASRASLEGPNITRPPPNSDAAAAQNGSAITTEDVPAVPA